MGISLQEALIRIQTDYLATPALILTTGQAHRLWNLPQEECEAALARLVQLGFLSRTSDGMFVRQPWESL